MEDDLKILRITPQVPSSVLHRVYGGHACAEKTGDGTTLLLRETHVGIRVQRNE
jgi:hypothetical protein